MELLINNWKNIFIAISVLYIINDINSEVYKSEIEDLKQSRQMYIDSAKVHFNNAQILKKRYNEVVLKVYSKSAKADSINNLPKIEVNYEGWNQNEILSDIDKLLNDSISNSRDR